MFSDNTQFIKFAVIIVIAIGGAMLLLGKCSLPG